MDIKTRAGFTLPKNHFPLKLSSGSALAGGTGNAYQNIINGNNLVRKAAQLVNDIEGLKNKPGFQTITDSKALNETSFQNFVDKIKAQLAKSDKPFTLLNVVDAQKLLSKAESEKAVDTKA